MDSKLDIFSLLQTFIEFSQGIEDTQARPYCSLGIIFMGVGIPKVDQETIPEQLGNMSFIALDDFCADLLVGTDHFP